MTTVSQRKAIALARAQKEVAASNTERTAFRKAELYWKNRIDFPDLAKAFRPENVEWTSEGHSEWCNEKVERRRLTANDHTRDLLGLPTECIDMILFAGSPGLIFLPGLLCSRMQRALVKCSLQEGPTFPNTTSLDPHYVLPQSGLWANKHTQKISRKPPTDAKGTFTRRETINLAPITAQNLDKERCESRHLPDMPRNFDKSDHGFEDAQSVLGRLRWACIGLPYHWTSKTYHIEKNAPPVPSLIDQVCRAAVAAIPWSETLPESEDAVTWASTYRPEGGIINFYSGKDSLTGHIDHSEAEASRPLVSVSLGADAVFLVGGVTRDEEPMALHLKSGDVVLMAGPARRVYHGLPRIFTGDIIDPGDDSEWLAEGFAAWVKDRRINLNVRQVFVQENAM